MKNNLIDGNGMTVTGQTMGENLERWVHKHGELSLTNQEVIRPLDKPIKETGHIRCVCMFSFGFGFSLVQRSGQRADFALLPLHCTTLAFRSRVTV